MRYNPCGRYTEMMRRPYQIPCRFLRDSELTSTLRWVEARPDALPLDKPSVIQSEDWSNDRGMWPDRIGEQDGLRKFRAASAPIGSGRGHVCGTDEEFDQGGLYEPLLPPVLYDAFGMPLCCSGARRPRGGAGAGGVSAVTVRRGLSYGGAGASGRAVVSWVTPIRIRGGAAASGRAEVTHGEPIRIRGGAAASGRAEVTHGEPITMRGGAGASGRSMFGVSSACDGAYGFCVMALPDDLGKWCYFENPTRSYYWHRWDVEPGEQYQFELFVTQSGGHLWTLFGGADCDGLVLLTEEFDHRPYQTFEFVAPSTSVWFRATGQITGLDMRGMTRLTLIT